MLKNSVQLMGNLGNNPEVKTLENGNKVTNFSIAVNEPYKDKDGNKVENVNWFNITGWNNIAEIVEKFTKKGSYIAVSGSLSTRNYEDKDGNKRYVTEIIAKEILLLDKAPVVKEEK